MNSIDFKIDQLNKLLEKNLTSISEIEEIIDITTSDEISINTVDLDEYDDEMLRKAGNERIEGVKAQNYEWASKWRDIEDECKKYIEFKNEFKISKAGFHNIYGTIYYFHFGNDDISRFLKKIYQR